MSESKEQIKKELLEEFPTREELRAFFKFFINELLEQHQ